MAGFYSLDNREVIRVKVKKCDGMKQPENKKFSIDPQITSFEMLLRTLSQAFNLKREFSVSYLARDGEGREMYLSMLSDWDMDAAFQCAADPCLTLKVNLKPFDTELEDWDVIAPTEVPNNKTTSTAEKGSLLGAITSNISSHVGRTVSSVQRAIGLKQGGEPMKRMKPPMSDQEFHLYLDSAGFMVKPTEFRFSIYQGGIESSLRRVAWRHLLGIFPGNLSGRDRFQYLKRKEKEYYSLRDEWKERYGRGSTTEEVRYVVAMVKKDVLRTDRTHKMFAGPDDNKNIISLFHILVTFALTHPLVSYCQGMSDLASPLLVIQKDEAQAYVCFCSLMTRLRKNFSADGTTMMTQFHHLGELLQVQDVELYDYLCNINAHDLFFCYRWMLLLMKREFPFEDALYMLEVMWSTLPPNPPQDDLPLTDNDYNVKLLSCPSSSPMSNSFTLRQSLYCKMLAMRSASRAKNAAPVNPDSNPLSPEDPKNESSSLSAAGDGQAVTCPHADQVLHSLHSPRCGTPVLRGSDSTPSLCHEVYCSRHSGCVDNQAFISPADKLSSDNNNDVKACSMSPASVILKCSGTRGNDNLGQSEALRIPTCANRAQSRTNSADLHRTSRTQSSKDSADSYSSFININLKLGTADELDPQYGSSPGGDVDKEELFNLSLESDCCSSNDDIKRDTEDEGYSGGRKKKSVCTERQAVRSVTLPNISSSQHTCNSAVTSVSSVDVRSVDVNPTRHQRGHSDSGVSEDSWSGGQLAQTRHVKSWISLPPPEQFGQGNPFLMFCCLTLLLQHREHIMASRMDYEDVAMYFDKMVRQHNVHKVLMQARELYTEYLREHQTVEDKVKFGLSVSM